LNFNTLLNPNRLRFKIIFALEIYFMNFIDTHAHIYLPEFSGDLEQTAQRARDQGISKIILPNIDSFTIEPLQEVCNRYKNYCYPLMGLHPTHVKDNFSGELNIIFKELKSDEYIGVGEIGIDLYWDKTYLEQQKIAFKMQVVYALENNLPVVIHARESFQQIIEVLQEINSPIFKGIFHAFPGNSVQAAQVIEMGFFIGVGGVVTYKNSHLPEVLRHIDLNHIVLETDSPYLSPVPYRGKRNESSYIPVIAEKTGQLMGKSVDEVAEKTTYNARHLFNL
jgi:TatD DNase family protein